MTGSKRKVFAQTTTDRYINPFTDFGFKRLFGEEPSKDILLDFLNCLLEEERGKIVSLKYLKNEQLGSLDLDRKAIFDIYCENEKGEKFIVEMQKAKHNYFKERTVFYSTFPIREQAVKGAWDYNLKAVYTIGILDFVFDEDKDDPDKFLYKVKLSDIETKEVFYDKLTYIYLEMPKFIKKEAELETNFDKWLYVLKNLPDLTKRPRKLQEKVFRKLFEIAEIANFSQEQLDNYEESLKVYRDLKGVIETALTEGKEVGFAKGIEEGIKEGRKEGMKEGLETGKKIGIEKGQKEKTIEIAKNLLDLLDDRTIASKTGLTIKEISKLRD